MPRADTLTALLGLITLQCAVARPAGLMQNILAGPTGERYDLVFHDEFDDAAREFGEGSDETWTSINSYNEQTGDFEAYVPDAVTTRDGHLVITTGTNITVDPSGTPRAFSSGMLQSWNKKCFTGGVVELSFKLPGRVNSSAPLWSAAWMAGILGRPALAPTSGVHSDAGVWPWSYDRCDRHNASQKYSACSDGGKPYCSSNELTSEECNTLQANKKLLGSHGRGMTEVDIFELFTNVAYQSVGPTKAALSTSLQVAPNADNNAWVNWDSKHNAKCFYQMYEGQYVSGSTYPYSLYNTYHGEAGRDSISAFIPLTAQDFEDGIAMRMEWEPKGFLRWLIKRPSDANFTLAYEVTQQTLAACGSTGQRDIPSEPQYLLFNTALSNQVGWVNISDDSLWRDGPYEFKIDYIRYYQRNGTKMGCSSDEYPSEEYIAQNPLSFSLPDLSGVEGSTSCSNQCLDGTSDTEHKQGIFSFYDMRCPVHGSIGGGGCLQPEENHCRSCYTKSAFEAAAFTADGVYGANAYPSAAAPRSRPICPPCVCAAHSINSSECAVQTLPEGTGCKALHIVHPQTQATLPLHYCSNSYYTTSVTPVEIPKSWWDRYAMHFLLGVPAYIWVVALLVALVFALSMKFATRLWRWLRIHCPCYKGDAGAIKSEPLLITNSDANVFAGP